MHNYRLQICHFSLLSAILIELQEAPMTEKEKVQAELNKIRPALQADGGDIELVDVKDGIVSVRLTGHCAG